MAVDYTRIVNAARNGNRDAIADLYEYTVRKVYYTAFKLTGSREDAETLTRDTYRYVFKNLDKLENSKTFPKWVRMITANLWKKHAKQYKPALFRTTEDEQNDLMSIPNMDENFLPDIFADDDEYRKNMMLLIDNLAENLRVPIYLHYFCGFSCAEVGTVMDVREGTIRARLNSARKAIRDRVHYSDESSDTTPPLLRRILRKDALGFNIDENMEREVFAAIFVNPNELVESERSEADDVAVKRNSEKKSSIAIFFGNIKDWFVSSKLWVKIAIICALVAVLALIIFGIASCGAKEQEPDSDKDHIVDNIDESQIPVEPIKVSALKEAGIEVLLGLKEEELYVVMGDEEPTATYDSDYKTIVYMLNSEEKEDSVKLNIYLGSDGTCRLISIGIDNKDWITGIPTSELTGNMINDEKVLSGNSEYKCKRGGILPMDNAAPDVTDKDVLSCYSEKFGYYLIGSAGSAVATDIYIGDLRYDPWWNAKDKEFMYPFGDVTEILGLQEDVLYSQYRIEPDVLYYSSDSSYIRVYTDEGYVTKVYIQDSAISVMGVCVGMDAEKAFKTMDTAGFAKMSETSSSTTYGINYYEFNLVISGGIVEQITAIDHSHEAGYAPVTRPEAAELYEEYYSKNYSTSDSFNIYADLTHDGMDEMIVVSQDYSYYNGAVMSVYTIDGGTTVKLLNVETYSVYGDSPAGQGEYYLYIDGDVNYIVYCVAYKDESTVNYAYRAFRFDDDGREFVKSGQKLNSANASEESNILNTINDYKNKSTLIMGCGNDFKLKFYNNKSLPNMDPKPEEVTVKVVDSYLGIQIGSEEETAMITVLGTPLSGYTWDGFQIQSVYGGLDTFVITGKGYSAYGLTVGMTKSDARTALKNAVAVEGMADTYNLPNNNGITVPGENWAVRITLEYSEDTVTKISYYIDTNEETDKEQQEQDEL